MIGFRETAEAVAGVLETRKPPPPAIVAKIAAACRVEPAAVTLLVAPTASLAGGVQIVARSVETALHKLAELKFDLGRIASAHGSAPLAPVAHDDLSAIGRTNDAVLYGARVVLNVVGDDASLEAIGPQVPSSSSRDHGEPFAAIFRATITTFTRSIPICSALPKSCFRTCRRARSIPSATSSRAFWSARSAIEHREQAGARNRTSSV